MSFTIDDAKELAASYLPVLLYDFVFTGGDTLHVARHDLTFDSIDYLGKVENEDIDVVAMLDASGVDIPPRLSILLADADSEFWANYEMGGAGFGFRGAIVTVTLVFFDVLGGAFSTDSEVRYVGLCDAGIAIDDTHLSIRTTYKALLQQKQLPSALIQQYCWKLQPQTTSQFALATQDHNQFWWCGLDATKYTGPCGYTRAGCAANDNLTRFAGIDFQITNNFGGYGENYISGAKVQLYNIGATPKYGDPFPLIFGTGWINCPILNMRQDGNYTRIDVALCIDQIDTSLEATTHMQVVVNGELIPAAGYYDVDPVTHVITAFHQIDVGNIAWWNWAATGTRDGDDTSVRAGMSGLTTPYGSEVVLEVVVPNSIASGPSEPTCNVLFSGPALRVYSDPSTFTYQWAKQMSAGNPTGAWCANPAWLLMYLLYFSGWDYPDLDIQSFIDAAAECAEVITYTSQYGGFGLGDSLESIDVVLQGSAYIDAGVVFPPDVVISGGGGSGGRAIAYVTPADNNGNGGHVYRIQILDPGHYTSVPTITLVSTGHGSGATAVATINSASKHQRYMCNLIAPNRRPSGDVIQGVRRDMMALLQPNAAGKIAVKVKGPLAVEQPGLPEGSNYADPVASVTRAGDDAQGYVAYSFDEDTAISIKGIERPITDTPNCLQFTFQDSENVYAATSVSIVDSVDTERIGQQVSRSIVFDGCPTNDQATRLANITAKETLYGNPVGDSRGTMWLQIATSIRALRIEQGALIFVTWVKLQLDHQLFRVMAIKGPARDGTVILTAAWHDDSWYVDSANQVADPGYSNPKRNKLKRASFPLCPDTVAPRAGDPLFDPTDKTFAIAPNWVLGMDGKWNGELQITTAVGVNVPGVSQPPQIALQANTATTGGSLEPGLYYLAVCSKDSSGKHSYPSLICICGVAAGTSTNTITIPIQWWDAANTVGYAIFAGRTPFRLTYQGDGTANADGSGTPATVTLTRYNVCNWGMPDQELDTMISQARVVDHSGILGAQAQAVATGHITIGLTWTADAIAGYELSVLAKYDDTPLPVLSYEITHVSTSGVLTVTPDPMLDGLAVGDVVAVRSKPTWASDGLTATDAMWVNPFQPAGLSPSFEVGKLALIIAGTGRGLTNKITAATSTSHSWAEKWLVTPDATSRYIVIEPNWQPLAAPMRGINNGNSYDSVTLSFPNANYAKRTILIGLQTEDGAQNPAVTSLMPVREIYNFGQPEKVIEVTADYTVAADDQNILVDTTSGPVTIQLLSYAAMLSPSLMIKKVSPDTNAVTVQAHSGEVIEGAATQTLSSLWSYVAIKRKNA